MKITCMKQPAAGATLLPRVLVEAETEADRRTMDRIMQAADAAGGCRDPEDGELVQVSLLMVGEPATSGYPHIELVSQAIEQTWGQRCDDHDPTCVVCQAWDAYDAMADSLRRGEDRP